MFERKEFRERGGRSKVRKVWFGGYFAGDLVIDTHFWNTLLCLPQVQML